MTAKLKRRIYRLLDGKILPKTALYVYEENDPAIGFCRSLIVKERRRRNKKHYELGYRFPMPNASRRTFALRALKNTLLDRIT